jgi:hypothetical protein
MIENDELRENYRAVVGITELILEMRAADREPFFPACGCMLKIAFDRATLRFSSPGGSPR